MKNKKEHYEMCENITISYFVMNIICILIFLGVGIGLNNFEGFLEYMGICNLVMLPISSVAFIIPLITKENETSKRN